MFRFIPLVVTALLCTLTPHTHAAVIVELTDVKANGAIAATAAHGPFVGNDNGLLTLLNGPGTATLEDTGATVNILAPGMFSTAGLPNTRVGSPLGDLTWFLLGKSDDANNGPFTSNPSVSTGTLTLDSALTGNIVLSLKTSNSHAVYAFQNVTNVISFDFTTKAMGNGKHDLSHASLYYASGPDNEVPEPASIAVWSVLGFALIGFRRWRKRRVG